MQVLRQGQQISGPDGVYMQVVPPNNITVNNIPTNKVALVGTAKYGPVNAPIPIGSPSSMQFGIGDISLDPFDLATEVAMALRQGCNNILGIRVTDGTDAAAAANLMDTQGTPGVLSADKAYFTGSLGNGFTRKVDVGSNSTSQATPTSYKVTITRPGYQPEVFDNIPATGFQAAYIQAINQGQAGFRGPSQFIKAAMPTLAAPTITAGMFTPATTGGTLPAGAYRAVLTLVNAQGETIASNEVSGITVASGTTGSIAFSNGSAFAAGVTGKLYLTQMGGATGTETFAIAVPNGGTATITAQPAAGASAPPIANTATIPNANVPALGTATLSGGTDGNAGVTSSTLLGVDGTGAARKGMYALRGSIAGALFGLAGCTDATTWSTMLGFGQSENAIPGAIYAQGTTTDAAIALKQSTGVSDWQIEYFKDWLYIKDTVNNIQRYVSPLGHSLGFIANLSPEQSPGNKPMSGLLGTERTMAQIPYDATELKKLEDAGIKVITNPIPYGDVFGFAHGRNGSLDPNTNQTSYSRVTLMITLSLGKALGKFIANIQSKRPDDQSRRKAEGMANTYMEELKRPLTPDGYGMIDDYKNTVDSSNNNATTVGQGVAIGYSEVSYLGVIEKFIWSIMGGQTVVIKR